jgi:ribonuclease HII
LAAIARIYLHLHVTATAAESQALSTYLVDGVGRVDFTRDADASHQLVSLASLVGKWVRDTWTARVIAHHQLASPNAPVASGYHDPVTQDFVRKTAQARRLTLFPDGCFRRD